MKNWRGRLCFDEISFHYCNIWHHCVFEVKTLWQNINVYVIVVVAYIFGKLYFNFFVMAFSVVNILNWYLRFFCIPCPYVLCDKILMIII